MNYTQKCALYGLYLTGFLLLIPLMDLIETKIPIWLVQAAGLVGVILLILPIYRLNKSKDKTFDELDKKICIRSGVIAILLLCAAAIAAYTIILFAFEEFSLSRDNLTAVIFFGAILFVVSLSLAVLFQYHHLNNLERA